MLTSVWNHRLLVVLFAAVFGALGLLVTSMRSPSYVADAGVLLEDPNPAVLADPRSSSDEGRYVANQVAILTSAAVADRASALALERATRRRTSARAPSSATCRSNRTRSRTTSSSASARKIEKTR